MFDADRCYIKLLWYVLGHGKKISRPTIKKIPQVFWTSVPFSIRKMYYWRHRLILRGSRLGSKYYGKYKINKN